MSLSRRVRSRTSTSSRAAPPRGPYNGGHTAIRGAVLGAAKLLMLPLANAAPLAFLSARDASVFGKDEDLPKSPDDPNLWAYLGVAIALVLLGGAFAGLTIALMGQDETYLQVIATSGEGSEKKHAQKVLGLLKKGKHWVLVTLLLSNVITNETLPIVLDRSLGGGWPAVVSSTVLIVIFGEIVPQSICVRYGLSIGAFMSTPVLLLMYLMFPVAWPTAKLLDYLLGEDHGTMYKKAGLKTLVQLHKTLGTIPGERLMEDEVTIINSVLDLKDKPVGDIMTPMGDVFTMSADTVLDEQMMDVILSQGYSRIPIYVPDNSRNFIGMLLVKILITYDPEDCKRVRDFTLATLPETNPYTSCLDIINFFQEGKSHMVLVSDFPGQDRGALGVVTLEDVIEELIGEEIIDESDVFVDVHKAIRRMNPAPRTRYSKGNALAESIKDVDLDDATEDQPLLAKPHPTPSRKSSLTNGQGINVVLRRPSASSDAPPSQRPTQQVRSNTSDLKKHLSHLGPSNAASNPKATKYKSITVKPAVGTIPEHQATTTGINGRPRAQSLDSSKTPPHEEEGHHSDNEHSKDQGHADPGLPAGPEASDAIKAIKEVGYGTIGQRDETPTIRTEGPEGMSASEASLKARENASPSPVPKSQPNGDRESRTERLSVPKKVVIGPDGTEQETDQLGEMEGPSSRDRSKPRRAARSGSITETTIDVGGMTKTVLEPGSSSSDDDDAKSRKTAQGIANAEGNSRGPSSADNSEPQTGDDTEKAEQGASGSASAAKKKKKKKGKKKGKGSD
ncbi:DUF21-domain-containing protein [Polychaeton citri CBS 116435]|uniref:DUF21-domain-containing protein n=1 Tax=Polychaeton citri CBS 116435 TaxID=1314669 RepID=A0A9P4Q459_9PEZI|nr:DUF21-domain-containing protein [Polychaeton citri CBS 116435]